VQGCQHDGRGVGPIQRRVDPELLQRRRNAALIVAKTVNERMSILVGGAAAVDRALDLGQLESQREVAGGPLVGGWAGVVVSGHGWNLSVVSVKRRFTQSFGTSVARNLPISQKTACEVRECEWSRLGSNQ
jgi:hypothetical protein